MTLLDIEFMVIKDEIYLCKHTILQLSFFGIFIRNWYCTHEMMKHQKQHTNNIVFNLYLPLSSLYFQTYNMEK
jgi:hypothetical protein